MGRDQYLRRLSVYPADGVLHDGDAQLFEYDVQKCMKFGERVMNRQKNRVAFGLIAAPLALIIGLYGAGVIGESVRLYALIALLLWVVAVTVWLTKSDT